MAVAIGRNDNHSVTDIKVHVACGNCLAVLLEPADRGQGGDFASKRLCALMGVGIDRSIRVIGVAGFGNYQMIGTDKAGEIVDMAVGMVVDQAFAQPQHPFEPQVGPQAILDVSEQELEGLTFEDLASRRSELLNVAPFPP